LQILIPCDLTPLVIFRKKKHTNHMAPSMILIALGVTSRWRQRWWIDDNNVIMVWIDDS
jgi:hypothetical protein